MALTLSAATVANPGQTNQDYSFFIVLDGTNTTATGLALPAGIPTAPNFAASDGPASISKFPTNTAAQAHRRVIYSSGSKGTSAVATLVRCAPNATNGATQIDVAVSAAGTNGQTVEVIMTCKDSAW